MSNDKPWGNTIPEYYLEQLEKQNNKEWVGFYIPHPSYEKQD